MVKSVVRRNVQMIQPTKFEAYNLEDLCENSLDFEYLYHDILSSELNNSSQGMEYSLVYVKNIIEAMEDRLEQYSESENPDADEFRILNNLRNLVKDKSDDVMVFIQGW